MRHKILLPAACCIVCLASLGITISIYWAHFRMRTAIEQTAYHHQRSIDHYFINSLQYLFNQTESQTTSPLIGAHTVVLEHHNDPPFYTMHVNTTTGSVLLPEIPSSLLSEFNPTAPTALYVKTQSGLQKIFDIRTDQTNPPGFPIQLPLTTISKTPTVIHTANDPERFQHIIMPSSLFESTYLVVAIPTAALYETVLFLSIGIILSVIGFIGGILFLLTRVVHQHIAAIHQISKAAEQMANGHYTSKVNVSTTDEVNHLAQQFNILKKSIDERTHDLIYEQTRSRIIFSQLPDGIVVTDDNHKLISANRSAELMLGFCMDRAKGQTILDYIKTEQASQFFSNYLKKIQEPVIRDITIPSDNGTDDDEIYQIRMSPLLDSTFHQTGVITIIRNITAEHAMRRMQDRYLHGLTHQLKTPLTSVIGLTAMLLKEKQHPLNRSQKEFLSIILYNANYQSKLINDLLELSEIQSGRVTLTYTDVSVHELIQSIQKHSGFLSIRSNTITFDVDKHDSTIYSDKNRLFQMIINLIINANHVCKDSNIHCIFTKTTSHYSIIVKDTGIGMNNHQKAAIIKALDSDSDANFFTRDTLTLELSIVKSLANLHNGQVLLESGRECGTIFTILLPIKPAIIPSEDIQPSNQLSLLDFSMR